jgi:hypothetical protein
MGVEWMSLSIYGCFYIEGSDRVWVEIRCLNKHIEICILSRESIIRSRRISSYYDKFLRRIIAMRGKPIECYRIGKEAGSPRIVGRKRIDDKIYIIVEFKGFTHRIYVPMNKIDLLKKCTL